VTTDSSLTLTDPREATAPRFLGFVRNALNDPRDVEVVWLMLKCLVVVCAGIGLFFVKAVPVLYLAPLYYLLLFGGLIDRFTLMLHFTSHRPLFNKRFRFLNHVIPWVIGPFFGQTPNTYFAHHMGMHHREENLAADLSSTMRFQRNRIDHWLRYYIRFMVLGLFELTLYFAGQKRYKLMGRVIIGEGLYWTSVIAGLVFAPAPTLIVFLGPLVVIRMLMMMGNWTQHAFICHEHPDDPYRASITSINTRYNRRCFNDGYHILHHVAPRCHWTEHPQEFEKALPEYGAHDAIVFDGVDYFQIWLLLMFRRWGTLADRFVHLKGAPTRTRDDVIALLKSRVVAFPR
jgi:fatty acid desaturase